MLIKEFVVKRETLRVCLQVTSNHFVGYWWQPGMPIFWKWKLEALS